MNDSSAGKNLGISADGGYPSLLEHLLEGVQVLDFDWRYLYLNNAAVQHNRLGPREDFIGKTMPATYPGIEQTPVFAMLRKCMEQRVPGYMEVDFVFPNGTTGWFEVRCEPVQEGIFILSVDITERKIAEENLRRSEEHLRQVQKMEAIGRLAAGVAHDFNNLLTVILLSSEMLLARSHGDPDGRPPLQQIKDAAERAAALTKQLLAFSRQQVLEPKVIDLNATVINIEQMLRRVIGEDIKLSLHPACDLGRIKADPGQIEQVIMNLCVNARDAMPQGGSLLIETANADIDKSMSGEHLDIPPGRYVMLAVSDTGTGMDKSTQARIFEPFFTTKEQGKGTGLGLSTVFGIVKQSSGAIWVYSEPGVGTTFKIYLPRAEEEGRPQPAAGENWLPTGTETVLLVEDDSAVRAMTSMALELAGYRVLSAARGKDAIRLCEKHDGPIHLLISDVIMPEMGGRSVSEAIRALRPEIRLLYVSGYTDDAVVRHGIALEEAAFLQKPFTPDSLARKVREVLGR